MSSDRHVVSAPSYAAQFVCVGSSCTDSCCTHWRVDVDKATYRKLVRLPVSNLSRRVGAALSKCVQPTDSQYAELRMGSGQCVALTDEKLCGIQGVHGESYLPSVCHFFPRHIFATGLSHEMHLSLACPEAARLCVEDQTDAALVETSVLAPAGRKLMTLGGFRVGKSEQLCTAFPKTFALLRGFIDRVLGARDLEPWEGLLLIQYACERVDALRSKRDGHWPENEIEHALLELNLAMLDGTFQAQVRPIASKLEASALSAKFVEAMTNVRARMGGISANGRQFFGLVAEAFEAYNADRELKALSGATAPSAAINPLALRAAKNFLRNQVGIKNFPAISTTPLSGQWREIVATYALVAFYLRWLAVARGERFNANDAVQIIQGFTKLATHNAKFLPELRAQLSLAGLDGTTGLVILTR